MSDVVVTLRSAHVGFARELVRDIAGRGYDESTLGILTSREVQIVWAIVERAKRRRALEEKQRRINELEAELAALKGVEWTRGKPELTLREYVKSAIEVVRDE